MTVLERLHLKELRQGLDLLNKLLSECKIIRDGEILKNQSAEKAANRLAIGTEEGRFHKKIMNMKSISETDFIQFKKDFIKKLSQIKFN